MQTTSQIRDPAEPRCYRQSQKRTEVYWALTAFFLLQFGLGVAIKTDTVKLGDGTTFAAKTEKFQNQLALMDDDPIIVLAFGSSRIMNGFDAGSLVTPISEASGRRAVVHNFGISGCGNIYSFLALEKLIAQGVEPDLVMVEFYPRFLVQGAEREWFQANEIRSRNFDKTERYGIEEVSRSWTEEWLAPWHTHRFNILNRVEPKLLPMKLRENWAQNSDEHGWIAVDRPLQPVQLETQVERFQKTVSSFQLGGYSCQALKDTISLCQQHNIECALVWMPETRPIRNEYHPQMKSEVYEFLDELGRERGVQIVNSRDWVEDWGFYDSCHLNRNGAIQFTKQLSLQALPTLQTRAIARSQPADQVLFK